MAKQNRTNNERYQCSTVNVEIKLAFKTMKGKISALIATSTAHSLFFAIRWWAGKVERVLRVKGMCKLTR